VGVVTGLILLFLGTLVLLLPPLVNQGSKLVQHAPQYAQQLQQSLARHGIHVNVQEQVERVSLRAGSPSLQVVGVVSGVVSWVTAFVTVAILTIYLLIEGPKVGTSLTRLLPRDKRLGARRLVGQIGTQVGGYMRGQIITSALAGGFSFATLWILGIPEAAALGALAAIADAIPLIGVLIALLPAALLGLTLSPLKAGIVVVVYLVYHQLESHVIAPRVYGNTLGLSLSVIVISILVGVELMGMLGAILALPVAAAIPSIVTYIQEWQEGLRPSGSFASLP
jgi:predicted PurR-regulated permease PerM